MRRLLLTLCLVSAASGQAVAQARYLTFGIGTESCATWLNSDGTARRLGEEFVAGLWTGLNLGDSSSSHQVGKTTDAQGKMGEVRRYCDAAPSAALVDATIEVWKTFRQQGR